MQGLNNLAVVYTAQGRVAEALQLLQGALSFNTSCAAVDNHILQLRIGFTLCLTLTAEWDCARAMHGAYTAVPGICRTDCCSARAWCDMCTEQHAGALLAAPSYAEAHNNLGVLQRDVGAVPDALASYARCLELSPDSRNAGATPFRGALALVWLLRRRSFSAGYCTEVMLVCRSAPESGSRSATGQNRLLAVNYIHQGEERLVCAAHEEWGLDFQRQFKPLPPLPPPPRHRRPAASRPASPEAAAAGGSAGAASASSARMPDDRASHMESLTGGGADQPHENGGNSVSSISSSDDEADVDSKPLVVGYLSPDLFTVRVHRPADCCAACSWQFARHAPVPGSWEGFSCRNVYLGIRQQLHKGRGLLWRP